MAEATTINFPGPAPYERRVTTPGVEETVLTDEDKKRLAEQKALEAQQVAQVQKQTAFNQSVAAAEQELEEQRASEMVKQAKERERVEAEAAKDVESWKRNVGGAYEAAVRAPTPSLFAGGRSTQDTVLRAFGAALMGIGDAGTNAIAVQQGRAPSSNTLHDVINQDLMQQRANIERLKDNVVMARTGLKDAQEAREQMLAQVDARGAALYKRLEALGRARLAAMKVDKAAIDGNQLILEAREKGLEFRQKATAGLTKKIEKATVEEVNRDPSARPAGGGVEADKNAAEYEVYAKHARWIAETMPKLTPQEVKTIVTVMKDESSLKGHDTINSILARVGIDPEKGASSLVKEYLDHVRRGGMAVGRLESGAAIGKDEGNDLRGYMLPGLSDGPKDLSMRAGSLTEQVDIFGRHFARPPRNPTDVTGTATPRAPASPAPAAPASSAPAAPAGSPEDVNSTAPLPEDPNAATIDSLQPGAKPAPAKESRRDQLLRLLRRNPTDARLKAAAKNYGITEADLGN